MWVLNVCETPRLKPIYTSRGVCSEHPPGGVPLLRFLHICSQISHIRSTLFNICSILPDSPLPAPANLQQPRKPNAPTKRNLKTPRRYPCYPCCPYPCCPCPCCNHYKKPSATAAAKKQPRGLFLLFCCCCCGCISCPGSTVSPSRVSSRSNRMQGNSNEKQQKKQQ